MVRDSIVAPAQRVLFCFVLLVCKAYSYACRAGIKQCTSASIFLGYPRRRRLAGDGTAHADELGTLEMIGGIGRRRSRAQMLPNLIEGGGEPT